MNQTLERNSLGLFTQYLPLARPKAIRSLRQFAEEELRLPKTGPHGGLPFRVDRQPVAGLYWDLVMKSQNFTPDGTPWNVFAATGPQQSGKTYMCWVVPLLWALFEWNENIAVGGPDKNILSDKWKKDIRPSIENSNFAHLLPQSGSGSKGGKEITDITFEHGVSIKFLTAGGDEKSRSGYSTRWLFATEIDGYDTEAATGREGTIIDQMLGRLRSNDMNFNAFLECTVSIEAGRIWQEYMTGTQSRIVVRCVHCQNWVTPERESLRGWEQAVDSLEAERALYHCPACSAPWSEDSKRGLVTTKKGDRTLMMEQAKMLHRGQEITREGDIVGESPRTRTLGFRYSGFNNLFVRAGTTGAEEWNAGRSVNRRAANKKLCQWVWAMPADEYEEGTERIIGMDARDVRTRLNGLDKWQLPEEEIECVTSFIDVGERYLHHCSVGWQDGDSELAWIPDYATYETEEPGRIGVDEAIRRSLNRLLDRLMEVEYSGHPVGLVMIDAGHKADLLGKILKDRGNTHKRADRMVWLSKGIGSNQWKNPEDSLDVFGSNKRKNRIKTGVKQDGQVGFKSRIETGIAYLSIVDGFDEININSDACKQAVQDGLRIALGQSRGISLWGTEAADHVEFSEHIVSEAWDEKNGKFVDPITGKAFAKKIANHYLDALAGNVAAKYVWRWVQLLKERKAFNRPLPPKAIWD